MMFVMMMVMVIVKKWKFNDQNDFQIANEEEESTFCLEHGMEYARDNPQKVKSVLNQFKPIEHGIKHATNNFGK